MRKNGHMSTGGVKQKTSLSLGAPHLKDEANRLFDAYLETFQQAPESDFLLKRYFFEIYFEKEYLQDNVFFIPRADFLWFFKYYITDRRVERVIELKKRSTEKAIEGVEIATILIRRHYTYEEGEEGAADIIYTRTYADREGEEFIMKNSDDAITHVEQLLTDFRNDRVTQQPY